MKLFATVVVAATFLFLCLDGYHNGIEAWQGTTNFDREPPLINWAHGWPYYFNAHCGRARVSTARTSASDDYP